MADGNRVSLEVDLSEAAGQQIAQAAAVGVTNALALLDAKQPSVPRLGIRNEEVPDVLGIGRSKFYELCKRDPAFLACSTKIEAVARGSKRLAPYSRKRQRGTLVFYRYIHENPDRQVRVARARSISGTGVQQRRKLKSIEE
jgi:hypothetical protein